MSSNSIWTGLGFRMSAGKFPDLIDKAVIDVGSNSVRLVVFRTYYTFFHPIFNEKVTASLGRGVSKTGYLNPDGVRSATSAIIRFIHILKARNVSNVYAVATAAVRDAKDGQEFLDHIQKVCGLQVQKLSGMQEARFSALGVIAGEPEADGLMADLGGSSLELVGITNGKTGTGSSYRLGPLALGIDKSFIASDIRPEVAKTLDQIDLAKIKLPADSKKPKTLYAVGGAWRSLALVHMEMRGYPLHILHNYRMSRKEARILARLVERQSPDSLANIPGLSTKRAATLPYAALLLRELLRKVKVDEVVISSFGLREGLLFDDLSDDDAIHHPVLSSVDALAHQNWSSVQFGRSVEDWMAPVFAHYKPPFGKSRTKMIQSAMCRLADIGARMHPDHRAQISFDLILFAPFAGLTHSERTALALAVFCRYAGPGVPQNVSLIMRLLDENTRSWATATGCGLRCAAAVSGRTSSLLARTSLHVKKSTIELRVEKKDGMLLTSSPARRLRDLADVMGLQSRLLD